MVNFVMVFQLNLLSALSERDAYQARPWSRPALPQECDTRAPREDGSRCVLRYLRSEAGFGLCREQS
jgi:hypothetical protein